MTQGCYKAFTSCPISLTAQWNLDTTEEKNVSHPPNKIIQARNVFQQLLRRISFKECAQERANLQDNAKHNQKFYIQGPFKEVAIDLPCHFGSQNERPPTYW